MTHSTAMEDAGSRRRREQPSVQVAASPAVPDISVLVVNYNTAHLLRPMWDALMQSAGSLTVETIIVDNASRDTSVEVLRQEFANLPLITNAINVGFGRANNQALTHAHGRYVLLLNTDAFVESDTLEKTVSYMDAHPECGILGVRLIGRDGALQPSCRYFPTPWNVFLARTGLARYFPRIQMVDEMAWDHAAVRECDWVPGCYYLVRREVVESVGLFDPRYFLYCEEVDHCRRAKDAGWKVVFFPYTSVVHIGGESAKSDAALTSSGRQISALQTESELLYFRKHHGRLGVLSSILLSTIADAYLALKALLRRGRVQDCALAWARTRTCWSLAVRTRLGMRPTR